MTLPGHDVANGVDVLFDAEGDQILFPHEVFDGHTLVDQTGRRESVVRCRDQHASMLLRKLDDRLADLCAARDHNGAGVIFDCAKLCLIAGAHDRKVVFIHELLHDLGARRANHNFSFFKTAICIAAEDLALERIGDRLIARVCFREHLAVVDFHI